MVDRSPPRTPTPVGRIDGLDGLRAIAVVGVLLYHAEVPWAVGGFIGVDVFFVLSGYLVTTLVLRSLEGQGSLGFGRFWASRLRRLAPAQVALIVATVLVVAVWHRDELAELRGQVVAALTGTTNWYLLANDASYFEQLGRPPLLRHLWSLAIELQFYLVFPLVLAVTWPRWRDRLQVMAGFLAVAIVASAVWMAWRFDPGGDPSRAYFDSFARLQAPLLGALLALVWRPAKLRRSPAGVHGVRYAVAGGLALAGLAVIGHTASDRSAFLYRGGFLATALLAVVVVAAVTHPRSNLGGRRGLGHPALVAIGVRSYGLYLWHWPVFALLRPRVDVGWSWETTLVVRLAVTVALTELCYRLVERPWHGRAPSTSRSGVGMLLRAPASAPAATRAFGAIAVVGVLLTGTLLATTTRADDDIADSLQAGEAELARAEAAAGAGGSAASSTVPEVASPSTAVPGPPATTAVPGPPATTAVPGSTTTAAPPAAAGPVTLVGDSVMVGAAPTLFATFGDRATIDAEVARQAASIAPVIEQLDREGRLGPTVVVQVGINGTVTDDDLRAIADAVAGRRLLVVNARVPRSWEASNNETVADVVPTLPNAATVDWFSASDGHRDWFLADGIHLTEAGRDAYASIIERAVAS